MGTVGVPEMMAIFFIALVLFGPKELPKLGRTLGKALTEFRRASTELKSSFEREMQTLEREKESLKEINENRSKLEQYEALCKQLGEPPAAVALAWLLHNPIVTAPIIGATKTEQIKELIGAVDLTLSAEEAAALEKPYRPHPILGHAQPKPKVMRR